MNQEQRLGLRTLRFFIFQGISVGVFSIVVTFVFARYKQQIFPLSIADYAISALFIFSIGAIVLGFVIALFRYYSSSFSTGEGALTITRGILSKRELFIPYRQIQNVYFDQSVVYRIFGLSKLVILTAGVDDPNKRQVTLQGTFDTIDSSRAQILEEYLLKRATVQEVRVV